MREDDSQATMSAMSDADKSTGQTPASEAPSAAPSEAASRQAASSSLLPKILTGAVIVLAVLLGVQWWSSYAETSKLKKELARGMAAGDTKETEMKSLSGSLQNSLKQIEARVGGVEVKQAEMQAQQLALAELYQQISKSRDEWVLSEIEQVLTTANQQLHLAGNIQGALIALQNADRNLAKLDKPQFTPIRRAIERDIHRLKALPSVDITGTVLRLDSIIAQVDKLPLYADERPALPPVQLKTQTVRKAASGEKVTTGDAVKAQAGEFWSALNNKWQVWSTEMWMELRQLVRVRRVEQPDALLVSPEQAYFIRENLKLRLLNARLSLLSRSEGTFRSDIEVVQDALNKYFDPYAKQTQATRAILKQVQSINLTIEMPGLESLAAVNNFKMKP